MQPGDLVLSRDESDPQGRIEAKVVEEVFVREAFVLELRLGGRVIRTTAEHPFHVQGKGWLPAALLQLGDPLSCLEGTDVRVEALKDTGEFQRVHNCRVADYHTYFVGCDEWGFSVWAHNATYDDFLNTRAQNGDLTQDEVAQLRDSRLRTVYAEYGEEVAGRFLPLEIRRVRGDIPTVEEYLLASIREADLVTHQEQRLHTLRVQDHDGVNAGGSVNLRTGLNQFGVDVPDTGIVYFLRSRMTGEVLKDGQTSTALVKGGEGKTKATNRWAHYFSNERDLLTLTPGHNVDTEIVYALTRGDRGVSEVALRIMLGRDDPNLLLWDGTASRLRNSEGLPIKSGENPKGLPYKNEAVRTNWLQRAADRGYIYSPLPGVGDS